MPNDSFYAIPQELRASKHWSLWKLEYPNGTDSKPTKVPYSYRGTKASVTNPDDWCTFDIAHEVYSRGGYTGLGFVFADSNPYSGIDLDDPSGDQEITARQIKIFNEFDSYSEVSPSGTGLHIIVKGKVPSGRRRDKIEIYSSGRYFTMTGKVYSGKPIAERQSLLDQLWEQMGGETKPIFLPASDEPQRHEDVVIIQMAANAENGDKFKALWNGDGSVLTSADKSGSAIDQALVNIIQFYTNNIEQIERIWLSSPQGKREKTQKRADYRKRTIQIAFDRAPMKVDIQGYVENINEQLAIINGKSLEQPYNGSVAQRREHSEPDEGQRDTGSNPVTSTITPPPGLMGDITKFLYESSPRPVPEIAIAGALGLMAGVCGRAYRANGAGLNLYLLLLAGAGVGKESMARGIARIISAAKLSNPTAGEFIGPSEIASSPAIIKYLANRSQCFVSVFGEFGRRLEAMTSEKASTVDINLARTLLDLYGKSGTNGELGEIVYSDKDKSTSLVKSPALSILGEGEPVGFYEALDDRMLSSGLIPRFTIIEYNGPVPFLNEHAKRASEQLEQLPWLEKFIGLTSNAKTLMSKNLSVDIPATSEVIRLLHKLDRDLTDKQNNCDPSSPMRYLWGRSHLKVWKIAALVAIGCNYQDPVITIDHFNWALSLVERDTHKLAKKFESGVVGKNSGEAKQETETRRIIKEYLTKDFDYVSKYGAKADKHRDKIICKNYFNQRLSKLSAFTKDRIGAGNALNRTIKSFVDTGYLMPAKGHDIQMKYGVGEAWYINPDILTQDN